MMVVSAARATIIVFCRTCHYRRFVMKQRQQDHDKHGSTYFAESFPPNQRVDTANQERIFLVVLRAFAVFTDACTYLEPIRSFGVPQNGAPLSRTYFATSSLN